MSEIHCFIIWNSAQKYKNEILKQIEGQFDVLKIYEINWSKKNFGKCLSVFYGSDFSYSPFQLNNRGIGNFTFILVKDNNPIYVEKTQGRGVFKVNKNVFNFKHSIRDELTKSFNFHGSINEFEARHSCAILLGQTLEEILNEKSDKIIQINRDVKPILGYSSIEELLKLLKETTLCRQISGFENTFEFLTNDLQMFNLTIDSNSKVNENAFEFQKQIKIKDIIYTFKTSFLGDNSLPVEQQMDILLNRKTKQKTLQQVKNIYYIYSNPSGIFVFRPELIRLNPKLATEIIKSNDLFVDLHRQILDENSELYNFLENNNKDIYFWKFSFRFSDVQKTEYYHIDENNRYFKKSFISGKKILRDINLTYVEEPYSKYIDGELVMTKLAKVYCQNGLEAFLEELEKFVLAMFNEFKSDTKQGYLKKQAWDMLTKNCFIRNNEYIFFDKEALSNSERKQEDRLAIIVNHLACCVLFLDYEQKKEIYHFLCKKFNLDMSKFDYYIKLQDEQCKFIACTQQENKLINIYIKLRTMLVLNKNKRKAKREKLKQKYFGNKKQEMFKNARRKCNNDKSIYNYL